MKKLTTDEFFKQARTMPDYKKAKMNSEYRELWNIVNARQKAIGEEFNHLQEIKDWIDRRSGINLN
jgi:hypothetical protein